MKFTRLCFMLILTFILTSTGVTVLAIEDNENTSSNPSLNFKSSKTNEFSEVNNESISSKNVDIDTLIKKTNDLNPTYQSITSQILNDSYEPNNTMETSTPILFGQELNANIGDAEDVDWYQIDLTAGTDVAFLLKNIPSDADYDLYIFDPDLNYALSENIGNADEKLYLNINTTGTWYIAIMPYNSYNAEENYQLFVGDAWLQDSFSVDTGMGFNYSQNNVGTILPYQILDLIEEPGIPDSARVTGIRFYTASSLGRWGNQTDFIYSAQSGEWYQTNPGLNVILGLPPEDENPLFVKQQWAITSSIETLFQVTGYYSPGVTFDYKYLRD
ncbi:PPC domain-containing protein [Gracilibacillus dipsosauri]|uniref:PPC domain-containing protein n=1 Tax=Gracilibacillus dipsosauri TaxID=178340 RepID=UPI0011B2A065|nr:PPC domain-containing protein [Gracilibacillus dipsosauri]